MARKEKTYNPLKQRMYDTIFEADTPVGRVFDIVLFMMIIASVIAVCAETVPSLGEQYRKAFVLLEIVFTIFFTIEYVARLYCSPRPWRYALSFYGIVDFVSILPAYIGFILTGSGSFMVVRSLRLLRIFRVFKLAGFVNESQLIVEAMQSSKQKISVFMFFIMIIVVLFGSLMYLIEGTVNPAFDSIPRAIYWAIVTLTTVGYGDISPMTSLGQFLSSIIMILGYAVIAVPTGIVSSEMVRQVTAQNITTQVCPQCMSEGHARDATYCKYCSADLNPHQH
jgi:voltage-gated potassium channel